MSSVFKIVLFTDEVKSTANMARRTPNEIVQVAREHRELTTEVVGRCRGKILKDTGDGYFIEFHSFSDAARCGFLLQERLRLRNQAQTNDRLRFELHVGIDAGEVEVLANGDVRGDAANRAARVCGACPAGEVYLTDKVSEELREAEVAKVDSVAFKGVKGKMYR
jgi:class 3 adenylate cyclase